MEFLYKTKDGKVGKVRDVNLLPNKLSKLIVKEYDDSCLILPYSKETIIDANLKCISDVLFNCDVLKIYNLGVELLITIDSKIREIAHIDMRMVTDMTDALMHTTVAKICELDYRNVVFSRQLFYGSQLTEIPPMKNYEYLDSDIFRSSKIPTHKEQTWCKLMEIRKNYVRKCKR